MMSSRCHYDVIQIEGISGGVREVNDKRELCLQLTFMDKMQRGLKTEVKEGTVL